MSDSSSSIFRPSTISSMSTPILNPKSSSQIQAQLGKTLQQHDPNAIRLYDVLNRVKVFAYNSTEFCWENNPQLEGNVFVYQKHQIIDSQRYVGFAFAVINGEQHFIQEIPLNMSTHADHLRLFYEIVRNNKCEVFCVHFLHENECQQLYTFINRSIEYAKEQPQQQQQSRPTVPGASQTNGQVQPAAVHRQPTPVKTRNVSTPSHLPVQQSAPVINDNSNPEDPTSSLKRLLNIPNPTSLDNEVVLPQQPSINLLPPSAFQSPPLDRDTQMHREHIRNVFLHLVQHNEPFLDTIYQACYTHQSQ